MRPEPDDVERVFRALGATPTAWRPALGHAAPSNRRWIVQHPAGRTAFVKIASFGYTAEWLRAEHANYVALQPSPHVPRLLGWDDDGVAPALVIEDLSDCAWPPPWADDDIARVRSALDAIHALTPPPTLGPRPTCPTSATAGRPCGRTPPPSCGWASPRWTGSRPVRTGSTMPRARRGSTAAPSCIWTCGATTSACATVERSSSTGTSRAPGTRRSTSPGGSRALAEEGGPAPWDALPGEGELAALLAGYLCSRAGLSPIPQAPHARRMQLAQGRVSLRWAARELGPPPPA